MWSRLTIPPVQPVTCSAGWLVSNLSATSHLCSAERISKRSKRQSLLTLFFFFFHTWSFMRLSPTQHLNKPRGFRNITPIFFPLIYTETFECKHPATALQLKLEQRNPHIKGTRTGHNCQAEKCRNKSNLKSCWKGFGFLQLYSSRRLLIMQVQSFRNMIHFNPSGWLSSNQNW